MQITVWRVPVRTRSDTVGSALEALDYLDHRWPSIKGPHFVKARYACLAALDGRETPEAARARFEDAIAEAQLM